jgi:hypothetical protein
MGCAATDAKNTGTGQSTSQTSAGQDADPVTNESAFFNRRGFFLDSTMLPKRYDSPNFKTKSDVIEKVFTRTLF